MNWGGGSTPRQFQPCCSVYVCVCAVKLRLPDDGNLYDLSSARFCDLLDCLRLDAQVTNSQNSYDDLKTNLRTKCYDHLLAV